MEVKIGVTDSPRELVLHSAQTPARWRSWSTAALGKESGVLALTDEKGRRFLVQATKIAYVEIGAADVAAGRLRHRSHGRSRGRQAELEAGKRHV